MAFSGGATAHVTGIVTLKDNFSKGLAGMQRGMGKLERYGGKAVSNLDRNLGRLAIVGGAAAFLGVKNVVSAAGDFQDAMARIEKTLSAENKTPQNLKKINDGLIEMSKRLPVTAIELAEIAKQAGQLGIESADDIMAFTETLAKLSRVTELDVGYAADNMGKLRTIFKMTAGDLDHFGNVLIALENSAASTVQEILNVTQRFAAAGKTAGLSADQIAGFASTVTSLGIRPEAAGSSLSRLFNRVAVEIANASDKAKNFAKFMHIPFKDLEKNFARDPGKFFVDFFKKVNEVYRTGSDVEKNRFKAVLASMGITNVRDVNAVQLLADGYEELSRQLGIAAGATNELDEAAKSRFASFNSKVQIFQNKLNAAAITIGNALLPALTEGMDKIASWIESHGPDITKFANDLGKGFSDFIAELKPDRIDAAVGIFKSLYDWASKFIGLFMSLPDPLKQLLIGLYVGNKLTGGVVGDILGDVTKHFFKTMAIAAGVVNVTGPVTGVGGAGGAAGAAGGMGLLSKAALLGLAALAAAAVHHQWEQINRESTEQAKGIQRTAEAFIAGQPSKEALERGLAGVRRGIKDITDNPLLVLVRGEALERLRAMEADLQKALLKNAPDTRDLPGKKTDDLGGRGPAGYENPSVGNFVKGINRAADNAKATRDAVKANQRTTSSGLNKVNRNVGRLARKPTKIGVANKTSVRTAIKMVVSGQTLSQAVYNSTASHRSTLRDNPSVGNFI